MVRILVLKILCEELSSAASPRSTTVRYRREPPVPPVPTTRPSGRSTSPWDSPATADPTEHGGQVSVGTCEPDPRHSSQSLARLRPYNLVAGSLHVAQAAAILVLANSFSLPVRATYMTGPPGPKVGTQAVTLFHLGFAGAIVAFFG